MASFACKLIVAAVFLFCSVQIGSSIRCFSCNLPPSKACDDPIANISALGIVDCRERNYGCLKQTVAAKGNQARSVHRGCTSVAFCDVHQAHSDHCSVCTNELCNSSSIVLPSLVVVFLSVLVKALLHKV